MKKLTLVESAKRLKASSPVTESLAVIASALVEIHAELSRLTFDGSRRLNDAEAHALPMALNVPEFAKGVNRSRDWVYDQIRLFKRTAGRSGVRVLPTGKPYQIPASELLRVKKGGAL